MPHNVFIASSVKAIAANLLSICKNFDLNVDILKDPISFAKELKESRFDLIFVDYNLIDIIKNDLIAIQAELNNTYTVIYGPNNIMGQIQKNELKIDSFLKVPISPIDVKDLFKRYFRLPGHVVLITKNAESEFITTLRAIGYRLTIVLKSEKIISTINATFPDLIITEFDTGGQDGAEICKEIKGIEPINKIPLLIACENRDVEIIEKLIISNPDDVMLSPYNSPNNIKIIQDLLPLPSSGRKLKALVVDDSGTIRNVISGMFMELGYEVVTAENGFEGFKAVQKFNPDIITSDYDMPVLNGWEFCTEIRDDDRFKDIPIIMITTRATDLDKKKGALLGVSAYLTKPFETNKLKISVEEAIAHSRHKKEQDAIAKYVAADTLNIVSAMAEGNDVTKGEDKFITVFFSDICAFSSKCERYSAKKIVNLLNTYFDMMVEILSEHEAIIDKFIGDAIVARFDTGHHAQDAKNCVVASWKMLKKLNEYNEESLEEIHCRIGVNSGPVILGNLGSEKHRLEYAMIGDNVNIGQRLESSAPKQGCMISASTYELVSEFVEVGQMQEIEVKGKKEKVKAHILEGLK